MIDKEMFKGLKCCASMGKMCNLCPYFYLQDCTSRLCQDTFDYIKRLNASNKDLRACLDALIYAMGCFNNKPYRKKFLEEVWEGEMGNKLSEPDGDFIYKLYFELRDKIDHIEMCDDDCTVCPEGNRLSEQANEWVQEQKTQIRKDTAKEILGDLVDMAIKRDLTIDDIHGFATVYGVEVDE